MADRKYEGKDKILTLNINRLGILRTSMLGRAYDKAKV